MDSKKHNNLLSKILKILYYIIISLACLIAIIVVYYMISSQINSKNENYRPTISMYTIVSPSMTPVINVYDVVINVHPKAPEKIEVGDIITYISKSPNSEGMTITHRVIEIIKNQDGTYEYITQGDNNSERDNLAVSYESVIGKEIMIIPGLGKIQFLIANKKSWLILLLIPVIIYLLKDVGQLIELFGLRKKVDHVAGFVQGSAITKKRIEEQERKEQIRENLRKKESLKESLIKNAKEPSGFLEKYNETLISVKENKYLKTNENIVENNEDELIIKPHNKKDDKKSRTQLKKTEKDLKKQEKNLSVKIEEYDRKLEELDKMIEDIEKNNTAKKEENIIKEETYLKESRIKVIAVEPTKNQKNKELLEKQEVQKEKSDIKKNLASKTTKKLNLNPQEIKKVNRNTKTGTIKPAKTTTAHPRAKKQLKSKKQIKK